MDGLTIFLFILAFILIVIGAGLAAYSLTVKTVESNNKPRSAAHYVYIVVGIIMVLIGILIIIVLYSRKKGKCMDISDGMMKPKKRDMYGTNPFVNP